MRRRRIEVFMYSYENYNKVKETIEARRENARSLSLARAEELRAKSAEIKEIDDELRGVGIKIFKAACAGEDLAPIRRRNEELVEKRRELTVKLGYPADYTDVKYSCAECMDTGFTDSGMCSCFKELLVVENIKSSGMGKLIEEQSFDNFNLSHYSKNKELYSRMEANVKLAKAYAEGFGRVYKGKNLLLIGKTGTGKTHISTAIAKEIISKGYDVLYESAQNIISAFEQDKFRSGYGAFEPKGEKYLECDLLILDDLGAEFVNQFTVACLYNIFNTRRNRGLSTIVSTNLSAEELSERYDDRIYSRIVGSDYTVLFFGGDDYRLFGDVR